MSTANDRESSDRRDLLARILAEVADGARDTAAIRAVRKRVTKQTAQWDRADLLALAHELIGRASYGRFMAYELVRYHAGTMRSIDRTEVEALGAGIGSWAEVDTFAVYVSGPAWRSARITDAAVKRWARSEDRWWRRAALVSTVALNGAPGGGDAGRTFAICKMLVADRDDMVVKAMSWALRELAKRAPDVVEGFVGDCVGRLAPRVVREVGNKLTTGLKNPRGRRA